MPEFYDVTDADFPVQKLEGSFGRDSIPGIDYPINDPPASPRGGKMRSRQEVFGVVLDDGPRAFPRDLLEIIELVNDHDGSIPLVIIVYDRSRKQALVFPRTHQGTAFTLGTTGYALDESPLLYDRRTKSLWLISGNQLACVNGPLKGTRLAPYHQAELMLWPQWLARHPTTLILMGNDRSKPIPDE